MLIRRGRDVESGNFRAFGLEYGNFMEVLERDTLFIESFKPIIGKSLVTKVKFANLYLLISKWLPQLGTGDIIEFGSYKGGCAVFMASIASSLGLPIHVYGLDTFSGIPSSDKDIDYHKLGDFSNTSIGLAQDLAEELNIKNITFISGLFEDTAKETLLGCKPILLAHIDCDTESSVRFSYDVVKDFMVSDGGYIVFDDPLHGSCLGAFQVIEDCVIRRDGLSAEQVYPHLVYRYPRLT